MSDFQPRNPDWDARCRASLAAQPIVSALGMTIARLEPGLCEMHLPFRRDLTQQHGFFQAGVVAMLADNAGGYAAYSLMPAGMEVLAVEFKVNFMSPAKGEVMIARGRVLKSGRTLSITAVEVFMRDDGRETLVAAMQQTCMGIAA